MVHTRSWPPQGYLRRLAAQVSADGVESNLPQVRDLVRVARELGQAPVMCQVALDPAAPAVVRERAVAQLIRRLARFSEPQTPHTTPTKSSTPAKEME
jgi:hypothetical protein